MPLTGEEKNAIAQGATAATQVAIIEGLGLSLAGGGFISLAFLPLIAGLTIEFSDQPQFPRLSPGDLTRAAVLAGQGFEVSSDPFFGDVVISTADQVDHLTELVRNSAVRRIAAEQDTSRLFLARRAVIEGLAESAPDRGFATAIDPNFRGQAIRATADSPLQVIERDVFL